ncbi:helix-turn-helix transcriptional regulator [Flavobacterium sp. JP2137]|uniref:helix-turn-helix transcriptional regulator n=1 Tax=Flavobacterium sp. JP2137 TaxID=3414510 RepID=UPI003D2FC5E9
MMLLRYSYLLVLTATVVLALATLYLNLKLNKRSAFDQVVACFLVFISAHSIYVCFARYLFQELPFVDIGAPFSLFYAPFFYTSLLVLKTASDWRFRKVFFHLVPAMVFVVLYVLLLTQKRWLAEYQVVYLMALYLGSGIQFIIYAVFGFVKFSSSFGVKELKLVTNHAVKIMVLVALVFLSFVFDQGSDEEKAAVNGLVIYLFMLLMAWVVFRYQVLSVVRPIGVETHESPEVARDLEYLEAVVQPQSLKYEKSRISADEGAEYLSRLEKAMEVDQLYLDSELTIDNLAKQLKMTKHHLTQVFTVVLDSNFNKHINQYRINHASSLLKDRNNTSSIGDIGTACGFNSRTSFFRVFKLHFGVSPADYRKQQA